MADRSAHRAASGAGSMVADLFDAKAASWPSKYVPGGPLVGRLGWLTSATIRWAPAGGRVLDLGCGTGELARQLAASGRRVTGCDISAAMLAAAAAAGPVPGIAWILLDRDWQALPFRSGRFDVVVAASMLEYAASPAAVLAECARVLRPGGVLVCTVPNLGHPARWLEWPGSVLARATRRPVTRAAGLAVTSDGGSEAWRRLRGYLTYLQVSRHRHWPGWWRNAAAAAGLTPVSSQPCATEPALRALIYRQDCGVAREFSTGEPA